MHIILNLIISQMSVLVNKCMTAQAEHSYSSEYVEYTIIIQVEW